MSVKFYWFAVIFLVLPLLMGCGGGGGGSSLQEGPQSGIVSLKVEWPSRTRLVPKAANSIKVSLANSKGYTESQIVDRPAEGNLSTITFAQVPSGGVDVTVIAYAETQAGGMALSSATTTATVLTGQTMAVPVDMTSTIATLVLSASNSVVKENQTFELIATAKDASGAIIPVLAGGIAWISEDPKIATVGDTGLVSGIKPGSVKITAIERESGKNASCVLTVEPNGIGMVSINLIHDDVRITVSPTNLTLVKGENNTKVFTSAVEGTHNPLVHWTVVEEEGGTISQSGLYTVPTKPGTYHVKATSIADPGRSATATVDVVSPSRVVNLVTNDLAYEPTTGLIYASISASQAVYNNSVVAINPETGTIVKSVSVGSNPTKLALSGTGECLYVAIDNAICKIDTISMSVLKRISLGTDPYNGALYAEDIEVMPGNANVILVSRSNIGFSPRHEGVAVYDDGVLREITTPSHTGSNVIECSTDDPQTVFGYNNETTDYGLRTMQVSNTGITITKTVNNLISGFGIDIQYAGGLLYTTSGRIIDPVNGIIVATCANQGPVCPDPANEKVYYATSTGIMAYETKNFVKTGAYTNSSIAGTPERLITCGADSLVLSTDSKVVIFSKKLL